MSKKAILFDRTYTGPRGPHLNCRTHFTLTGEHKPIDKQIGIHPSKFYAGLTVRSGER